MEGVKESKENVRKEKAHLREGESMGMRQKKKGKEKKLKEKPCEREGTD